LSEDPTGLHRIICCGYTSELEFFICSRNFKSRKTEKALSIFHRYPLPELDGKELKLESGESEKITAPAAKNRATEVI
jgi:hypothetical protein